MLPFYGYSSYAPAKFAIRALGDCLRDELHVAQQNASVHVFFTSTIHTEGFAVEQRTKPLITKRIEVAEASDATPAARAATLVAGVERHTFAIASDWMTDAIRAAMRGCSPASHGLVIESTLAFFGSVILPLWKVFVDRWIIRAGEKVFPAKKVKK